MANVVTRPPRDRLRTAAGVAFLVLGVLVIGSDHLGLGKPGHGFEQVLAASTALVIALALLGPCAYGGAALLLANTVVAFLVVNLVLAAVYRYIDHHALPRDPISEKYGERLLAVHPGRTIDEIHELHGIWRERFAYDPYTQFRLAPVETRFVRVTRRAGATWRRTRRADPPDQ